MSAAFADATAVAIVNTIANSRAPARCFMRTSIQEGTSLPLSAFMSRESRAASVIIVAVQALDALDAIAAARHADPFAVLGPHVQGGNLVIRAFHPSAARVDVAHAAGVAAMVRVHPAGIF